MTANFGTGEPNGQGGSLSLFFNFLEASTSQDINLNGIPDDCETHFHRADPDSSGTTDISDAISILGYLFLGGTTPSCLESADVDNDAKINIADGIALLNWLFRSGPEPAPPGPAPAPCGLDPDPAGSERNLGCESYVPCA